MRFLILAIGLLLGLFTNSCGSNKIDAIDFVDSFESVQKSIIEFDSLLAHGNALCKANYSFSFIEDTVEINNSRVNDVSISLKHVCPAGRYAVGRLQQLTRILKKNHITYVYKLYGANVNVFGYYYSYYTHGHEIREIVIDKRNNKNIMSSDHEPLDSKGKLILFAVKGR